MVRNLSRPRILQPPKGSLFLFGPRGIGKSTWAREHFVEARRFDLLDEGSYQELLANPALFSADLRALDPGSWVVVDEIQRIPSLLNEVHRGIEERRLRFVLLGSSARKLKTAGTNLLAGRATRRMLFPFVPEELGADFRLEEVLRFGSIPLVWSSEERKEALTAYVQVYLKEEIRAEALVRNLAGFSRFLPLAALFHGQILNVSSLARDSGTARTTVAGHLDILEDTLLAFRLPAFEAKLRARERKHPKLYWVDPGLVRAVKKQLGPVAEEEKGALFEGWAVNLLRAYAEVSELYDEIFYWSPAQARGVEVDFLLRRGSKYLALEVKAQQRLSPALLSGLRAVGELKGIERRVLVYGGDRKLRLPDGVEAWPVGELLTRLERRDLW